MSELHHEEPRTPRSVSCLLSSIPARLPSELSALEGQQSGHAAMRFHSSVFHQDQRHKAPSLAKLTTTNANRLQELGRNSRSREAAVLTADAVSLLSHRALSKSLRLSSLVLFFFALGIGSFSFFCFLFRLSVPMSQRGHSTWWAEGRHGCDVLTAATLLSHSHVQPFGSGIPAVFTPQIRAPGQGWLGIEGSWKVEN